MIQYCYSSHTLRFLRRNEHSTCELGLNSLWSHLREVLRRFSLIRIYLHLQLSPSWSNVYCSMYQIPLVVVEASLLCELIWQLFILELSGAQACICSFSTCDLSRIEYPGRGLCSNFLSPQVNSLHQDGSLNTDNLPSNLHLHLVVWNVWATSEDSNYYLKSLIGEIGILMTLHQPVVVLRNSSQIQSSQWLFRFGE